MGKLTAHQAFLVELVEQDSDITLPELRDASEMAAGMRAHPTSISRTLRRLGFSYKKIAGGGRAAPR